MDVNNIEKSRKGKQRRRSLLEFNKTAIGYNNEYTIHNNRVSIYTVSKK